MDFRSKLALVNLHHDWPDRDRLRDQDEEASRFLAWLQEHHGHLDFVDAVRDVSEVANVLKTYRARLDGPPTRLTNARNEARFEVRLSIYIKDAPRGTRVLARGQAVDAGRHGLKISLDQPVPPATPLEITATLPAFPIRIFHLTGESRWHSAQGSRHFIGIAVNEDRDYDEWAQLFAQTPANNANGS